MAPSTTCKKSGVIAETAASEPIVPLGATASMWLMQCAVLGCTAPTRNAHLGMACEGWESTPAIGRE